MVKMPFFTIIGGVLLILLAALVFAGMKGCETPTSISERDVFTTEYNGAESPGPINVSLSFSSRPELNKPVELTFDVTSAIDVRNAETKFVLPKALQLVQGTVTQRVHLRPNESHRFSVMVQVTEEIWDEEVKAIVSWTANGKTFTRTGALLISVSKEKSLVRPFPTVEDSNVSLSFSSRPELNKPVELTFDVTSAIDVRNAETKFVLPKALQLVQGTVTQRVHLRPNESHRFSVMVQVTEEIWDEEVKAIVSWTANGKTFTRTGALLISVWNGGSSVTKIAH